MLLLFQFDEEFHMIMQRLLLVPKKLLPELKHLHFIIDNLGMTD